MITFLYWLLIATGVLFLIGFALLVYFIVRLYGSSDIIDDAKKQIHKLRQDINLLKDDIEKVEG